ncbi:hypothetical protein O181_022012 [Austropuccinia psidii MF-1]|uniref:Uncharacterized protein n=1 Tax=Austropuccinia psidii MF-1 TaxID=1389203 RepID=A0A9Q3CGM5_9BASI|nr:hypothetical protein [Austropuccinia psidii MF-1]
MSIRLQDTNISEEQVIVAFHSFLQGALAQAHLERLLDSSILSSAQADIQIQGPSICLFLAALRSEGDPPSIATSLIMLNQDSCPPSFRNWFILWSQCVPKIKGLSFDLRHDLARIICDQEPQCQPIRIDLPIIAQNLRAIAIEISQRHLDYALQHGPSQEKPLSSNFKPPPAYDDTITDAPGSGPLDTPQIAQFTLASQPPQSSLNLDPSFENHPALQIIRETLYASLADTLYATPTVFSILQSPNSTDAQLSRAYFASLCLALLEMSLTLVNSVNRTMKVVNLGSHYPTVLKIEDCPPHLLPIAGQLFQIADSTQDLLQQDTENAIQEAGGQHENHLNDGKRQDRQTKLERLRLELEYGTNCQANEDLDELREQIPIEPLRVVANRINELALRIGQIPSFREREEALFMVLIPCLAKRQKPGGS